MSAYQQLILEELARIEKEEQVRILYACESGSRAWGFPSKDSDYDVRFIYIRPLEWYLSIFEQRDVIERPISNMLDVNGWDLKKALKLFRKSNPPLLEWLQSPIRYQENYSIAEQIRCLAPSTFSPRSCMYHYLHMAKGNYREYLQGEQVKIKKYFYVLRPILACEWIEKYNTMPPIEFQVLVEGIVSGNSELRAAIQQLLVRKMAGDELDYEPKIHAINAFLEEKISFYDQVAAKMSASTDNQDQQLNKLFRSALDEVWA
ncbi:nucleotidyltransferase domain-containing protein [Paenibacillus sp. ACRRX]|uniref:nucleotidyltransferase domain-containing protein n=1 Tax=unclassified Paenibacillus TaxID=185978 RepID=UPI001EF6E725|nr:MULTISPECIES: nucleotidyltransferase domain-containing protein [unclassified Paenibacillus]MCG7408962.1 nucleotidyltransferase domain-containing protein [Paenibacillus sp. ACRRX]MDK8182044.1 nucleotidyltransferase domain-containing protein [Paenibacillus sp. UMB4589-SE434]